MAKRGRPREEPSERFDMRLKRSAYDALCREAFRRGIPAATLARRVVTRYLLSGEKSAQPHQT